MIAANDNTCEPVDDERAILDIVSSSGRLPFPTRHVQVRGGILEEYVIPDNKKEAVLQQLYPFRPVPSINASMYDLHEERTFTVRDFRVMFDNGRNLLVSPYYPLSGGSVIDWI